MNWEDEPYVRLYTNNTADWNDWPWQARAIFPLLLRAADRSGIIAMGRRGIASLASLLAIPVEVVEPGIAALLDDGCVVSSGNQVVVRNYIAAQTAVRSDRARARESRERNRTAALGSASSTAERHVTPRDATELRMTERDQSERHVTPRDGASRAVTCGHAASRRVTLSSSEHSLAEDIYISAGAGARVAGAPEPAGGEVAGAYASAGDLPDPPEQPLLSDGEAGVETAPSGGNVTIREVADDPVRASLTRSELEADLVAFAWHVPGDPAATPRPNSSIVLAEGDLVTDLADAITRQARSAGEPPRAYGLRVIAAFDAYRCSIDRPPPLRPSAMIRHLATCVEIVAGRRIVGRDSPPSRATARGDPQRRGRATSDPRDDQLVRDLG